MQGSLHTIKVGLRGPIQNFLLTAVCSLTDMVVALVWVYVCGCMCACVCVGVCGHVCVCVGVCVQCVYTYAVCAVWVLCHMY